MSTPVKHSITIIQGTTQHVPLVRQYVEYAVKSTGCGGGYVDACTGTPVPPGDLRDEDYTGCTARMQLREDVDSSAVLWEMTTDNGRIALGGTAGTVDLLVDASTTAAIAWTGGVFDLEIVHPSGEVTRLAQGSCCVSPEVTRD